MDMDDHQIIALFWERSENALIETEKKYGQYCNMIANQILQDREEASECVNDAYLRLWNAIPPKRPEFLRAFLGKIVRNLAINRVNLIHAQKRGGYQSVGALSLDELSDCIPDTKNTESVIEEKELTEVLNHFLSTLPKDKRILFMKRYWFSKSIKEISEETGLRQGQIRTILYRARKDLKNFLSEKGVFL